MSDTEYISKDAFVAQQRKQYCVHCERRKGTKNGERVFVYEIGEAPCRSCDIEDMIDAVWDFLPADVAPVVHGRWIAITADVHRCSNCDQLVRTKDIVPYRFCNVCGAKMDENEARKGA